MRPQREHPSGILIPADGRDHPENDADEDAKVKGIFSAFMITNRRMGISRIFEISYSTKKMKLNG
jgi:hypothetical protein